MHAHLCNVCQVEVARCAEACQHDGEEYCSLHHPKPEHHIDPTPPAPRYAVLVKDSPKEG